MTTYGVESALLGDVRNDYVGQLLLESGWIDGEEAASFIGGADSDDDMIAMYREYHQA